MANSGKNTQAKSGRSKSKRSHSGPSQRQLRVGELIRRELAGIFSRGDHFNRVFSDVMISIGEVRTSPDLKVAKVAVYPHTTSNTATADAVIAEMNRIAGGLRKQVTDALKLKYSPELRFDMDTSFDNFEATARILETIKKTDENRDEDA